MNEKNWTHGMPLADASWEYASPAKRNALKREVSDKHARLDRMAQQPPDTDWRKAVTELLGAFSVPEAERALQNDLFEKLKRGALVAYGVPVRPIPSTNPVEIPATMLIEGFLKWTKSCIEGGGHAYRDVRIYKTERPSNPSATPNRERQADKSVRPLTKPAQKRQAIVDTFHRLCDEGQFDRLRSKKAKITLLISELKTKHNDLFPTDQSLGDGNLRRILRNEPRF